MSHKLETLPNGYQGPFTIELVPDHNLTLSHVPSTTPGVVISADRKTITVAIGRVVSVTGGLQFYAYEIPFSFGWNLVNRVLDNNDEVLWQNWYYKG